MSYITIDIAWKFLPIVIFEVSVTNGQIMAPLEIKIHPLQEIC